MPSRLAFVFVAALLLASCVDTTIPHDPRQTDPIIGVARRGGLGDVLTADGMTVYLYTLDAPGSTVCYDLCAMNWPPLLVTRAAAVVAPVPGRFGRVVRSDGRQQLTYNNVPLYLYIEDAPRTDQTNGQDVDHEWYVVHP